MDPVLVTGVSGYVGGVIAATLAEAGVMIVGAGRGELSDVRLDLRQPTEITKLGLPSGMSACIHCAALNEVQCAADPIAAFEVNVTATRALLEAALSAGIRRFIYVSTFHVFGRPAGQLTEDLLPVPANDYGLTHRFAEEIFLTAARTHGVEVYILRPANLYGFPADWRSFRRWTLAPFDFVRQATESGEIVLRTDGSSRRSYVSLEMLARTVLDATTGRLKPGVMHVTGRSWSMLQLAQAVSEVMFGVGLERIRIRTGSQDPDETPYSFCSHILPAELDHDGSQMRAFLQSLGCYLISLGGVGNE